MPMSSPDVVAEAETAMAGEASMATPATSDSPRPLFLAIFMFIPLPAALSAAFQACAGQSSFRAPETLSFRQRREHRSGSWVSVAAMTGASKWHYPC